MTIIIPAYNCIHTLGRTLDSLLKQTNQEFSVVIVDDCSTENLSEVIDKYSAQLNISYVRSEVNKGCGGARQVGIEVVGVSDNFITFVDADDILLPNAVELWSQYLTDDIDIIYSFFLIKELHASKPRPYRLSQGGSGIFMTHGKVYNTKFLQKYNIYSDERIRYCYNDYFLNHQALNYTENIIFLDEPTYVYIKTPGCETLNKNIAQTYGKEMRNIANIELKRIFNNKTNYDHLYHITEQKVIWIYKNAYVKMCEQCKHIQI